MKIFITSLLFVLTISNSFSKNKIKEYYGINDRIVKSKKDAIRFQSFETINDTTYILTHHSNLSGTWEKYQTTTIYKRAENKYEIIETNSNNKTHKHFREVEFKNGIYLIKHYRLNGKLKQEGKSKRLFPLLKEGVWVSYRSNGTKFKEETHLNNELVSIREWDKKGKEEISDVFNMVDIMPKYKSGMSNFHADIKRHKEYPIEAQNKALQGTVHVEIVIMEDGELDGIKVIKGVHPILNKSAIRTIKKLPNKWTPGYLKGKPVRVRYIVPLNYVYQKPNKSSINIKQ